MAIALPQNVHQKFSGVLHKFKGVLKGGLSKAGKPIAIIGAVFTINNIVTAQDKGGAIVEESEAWIGSALGGGAAAGAGLGPFGVIGGAAIGATLAAGIEAKPSTYASPHGFNGSSNLIDSSQKKSSSPSSVELPGGTFILED